MHKSEERAADAAARTGFDWRQVASTTYTKVDWAKVAEGALGSALLAGVVGGALHILGKAIEADMRAEAARRADDASAAADDSDAPADDDEASATADDTDDAADEAAVPVVDPKVADAAALLGVEPDASAEEIRAALRAALASSRLHPDHGGDGEAAKRLIAAKNLLIERVNRARTVTP